MAKILGIKTTNDEKVTITLDLTQKELIYLQGNMEKIHIFSEKNLTNETRLVQRGKRESTKYFLLPKTFRKDIQPSKDVKCNIIETNTKHIFIFEVPKY